MENYAQICMARLKFYQRLAFVSGLVLALLNHFAFGFLGIMIPFAKADTVIWVGPPGGSWDDPLNWSGNQIPTAADNVIIDLENNGPVFATSTINFASLTLQNMNKDNGGGFVLEGTIGSGGDITMETLNGEPGNFTFISPQTISGTLTIGSGTALVPFYLNTSTPIAPVSFTAENIIVESGGYVDLRSSGWSGFQGGDSGMDGQGPGAGIFGTGPNGSGGAHAGNGGMDTQGDLGGEGYCNLSQIGTIASGGAGGGPGDNNFGSGGSFLELVANNELVVNGYILGTGGNSEDDQNNNDAGGGGGGAGIILSADVISGTPELFDVSGGNSIGDGNNLTSGGGGGGGGGCVLISYGTSNSITADMIQAYGGFGYQRGGAGKVLIRKEDDSVRQLYLSSVSNSSSTLSVAADTVQIEDELIVDTLTIDPGAMYVLGSGKTLTLTSSTPFAGSSATGTIQIQDGGILKIDADAVLSNIAIELHEGGQILDRVTNVSNSLNFNLGQSAIFDMRGFTTATAFSVKNFTANGATITHGSHEFGSVFTHMVNIYAEEEITISSDSVINVSEKGFAGGTNGEDGNGPGGGEFADMFTAVGAGHGGAGAASDTSGSYVGVGGSSYCDAENPSDLGSGGASGYFYGDTGFSGGNGGGLVWLHASEMVALSGNIYADGGDGDYGQFIGDVVFLSSSGGGSGGGVKIVSPIVWGSGNISVAGGDNGVDPDPVPSENGGGGGGCVYVNYVQQNMITSSSVARAGGGFGGSAGAEGVFTVNKENESPQLFLTIYSPEKIGEVGDGVNLNQPFEVAVSSTFAYVVASGDNSLRVIDVSSSTNPQIVGGIKDDVNLFIPVSVALKEHYAFVTAYGDNSLRVIDVSSSTNPQIVGGIKDDVNLEGIGAVEIVGEYAYVTGLSGDFLRIVDISDPVNPEIVGGIVDSINLNGARGVAVSGQYAYVVSQLDRSLQIINISNPATPVIVGGVRDSLRLDNATRVAVSGQYAYVTGLDYDAILVIDISVPTNPEIIRVARGALSTNQPPFGSPNDVSIIDDSLYVSYGGDHSGVAVFDISNPEQTHLIGNYSQSSGMNNLQGIYFLDGKLYGVSYDDNSLHIFDTTRKTDPDPDMPFYVYDNDRDTISVKSEYRIGSCDVYTGLNYMTLSTSTVTSSYGASIDNAAIGGRRIRDIEISPSADYPVSSVTTTWLTTVDDPGSPEGNYCVFLTPYDGELEGERVSVAVVVDNPELSPSVPVLSVVEKTQTSIELSWNPVGAEYYTVSSSISEINTETTDTSVTYAGLSPGTTYVFQIKATDYFGNSSPYSSVLSVTTNAPVSGGGGGAPPPPPPPPVVPGVPSTTPSSTPSNPSGLILINGGVAYTNSRNVTLTFNTNFTETYALSDSGDFTGKQFLPIVPTMPYLLSQGDGEKKVYARFTNMFGVYDAYDVILLDTQAPITPVVTQVASSDLVLKREGVYGRKVSTSTNRVIPTITGSAEPGSRMVFTISSGVQIAATMLRLANVQTFYTPVDSNGQWSFTFPLNMENTTYQLMLQTEDTAGNLSQPTYTYFDFSVAMPPVEQPPELPPIDQTPTTTEQVPETCVVNCTPVSGEQAGNEQTVPGSTENAENNGTTEERVPITGESGGEAGEGSSTETGGATENTQTEESSTTVNTETSAVANVIQSASVVAETLRTIVNDVGEVLIQIPVIKKTVEVAGVAVEKTREVIDNPVVEKTNETVAAPVITTVAVVNVVTGGASVASQVLMYLRLIFSQPLLLIRRKRQKNWGTVFNAYSRQPIDLAMVRLINDATGQVIRTQVTDMKGRYFMVATQGAYRLEATKEGFEMHDLRMDSSLYPNIYQGGSLSLGEEHVELNYNIPLRQKSHEKNTVLILKEYSRAATRKTTSMIGAFATIGSFIISPKPWITALLLAHIILYGVMKRVAQKKVKGTHGTVVDGSGQALSKVVIRVFDAEYNKLVDTAVTDGRGRYAVLVGPSTYYIMAEKQGYELYKSEILDFSSQKTKGVGGVISEKVTLKAMGTSVSGKTPEDEVRVRTMPLV